MPTSAASPSTEDELDFDELFRRRPEFDPESIPLAIGRDGLVLHVPPPRVTVRFRFEGGRPVPSRSGTFGEDFDVLAEAVGKATNDNEYFAALAAVAIDLLGRNYEASPAELAGLLEFSAPLGELPEAWQAVQRIAAGMPPKRTAPGSSPPA